MELLTHKSDAGPEIIALSDPAAFTVSLGWFVKTGSRDEKAEVAGVSHFLEHMVFKGTSKRSAEGVNRAEETLHVLLETINSLGKGISQVELERLKNRSKSSLVMEQESSMKMKIFA